VEPLRVTSIDSETAMILEENMSTPPRKIAIAAAAAVTIAGTTTIFPTAANAQHWHGHGGHWGGGRWHGGGGGFGWGFGPGFALGFGGPYYYGGPYAYAGDCTMRRRWVVNRYGQRVWRWVRVCY
jgi:hypothetical protein